MGSIIFEIGQYIYSIYYWIILISILGSWFPQFYSTKLGIWVRKLVDPYLNIFRRFIPPIGMLDLSPIVALIAYRYIGQFALEGLRQVIQMIGI
ncbi:YggT family protein [Peribacillus deserti]|uniref:YggT family protein n=1 Tax=Peribacillus deserti TaxID=673318 RepID=A0A2N5LZJ2_9BACI|nr:YggT family protein [Peribacillus deserti]PLT27539.1 YggT family protein [Peribacillus deserti]